MLTFVSKSAHVCDPVLTIVTDEPLSAADARVNRTTPLLTNVSNAARLERGDVSQFFRCAAPSYHFLEGEKFTQTGAEIGWLT
jgi:hypothetical protein